jgi:hypothetical protein
MEKIKFIMCTGDDSHTKTLYTSSMEMVVILQNHIYYDGSDIHILLLKMWNDLGFIDEICF